MDLDGLHFLVDVSSNANKLIFSQELGISHCHDEKLKEQLLNLVPLDILRDGSACVLGYLERITPPYVKEEIEFLKGLDRRLAVNFLNDRMSFCPDGKVVCTDEELVRDVLKKIPKDIISRGANPTGNHLRVLIKTQEELFAHLTDQGIE